MSQKQLLAFLLCDIAGLYSASIRTKVKQLRLMAAEHSSMIVALTETQLYDYLNSAEVDMSGFQMYRKDGAPRMKKVQ